MISVRVQAAGLILKMGTFDKVLCVSDLQWIQRYYGERAKVCSAFPGPNEFCLLILHRLISPTRAQYTPPACHSHTSSQSEHMPIQKQWLWQSFYFTFVLRCVMYQTLCWTVLMSVMSNYFCGSLVNRGPIVLCIISHQVINSPNDHLPPFMISFMAGAENNT